MFHIKEIFTTVLSRLRQSEHTLTDLKSLLNGGFALYAS